MLVPTGEGCFLRSSRSVDILERQFPPAIPAVNFHQTKQVGKPNRRQLIERLRSENRLSPNWSGPPKLTFG